MDNILRGIPAMSYGHPSPVCYIGAVMRLMEYLGDPVEEDELFALSGVGLCFSWQFNSCCDEVSIIPDIPRRTFEALGYASEYYSEEVKPDGGATDVVVASGGVASDGRVYSKEFYFEKIKRSIDGGRPVIGFGFTEVNFTCLITGYDDDGGLYLRAYWPPKGTPSDFDTTEYYDTKDWYDLCRGILVVGAKTGERLAGAAAYDRVAEWALFFRCNQSVTALGQTIPTGQAAFDAMSGWLLDDGQWQALGNHEQYLKQCGLLLLDYYRNNLRSYLKKLDAQYPGVVNKPVFTALERIDKLMPGHHHSDLHLNECVDPAITDFSVLRSRSMREKVAKYVQYLKECDNSIQWTLFMPGVVKNHHGAKIKRKSFEYITLPATRFIGLDALRTGEDYGKLWGRRGEFIPVLERMTDSAYAELPYNCALIHHDFKEVNNPMHYIAGRFMKAGTPVPEGFDYHDFPPMQAAYAVYDGEFDDVGAVIHTIYDFTRDQVLGDGVAIPYPHAYWTAEVYLQQPDAGGGCRLGYLFSVADWEEWKVEK